ncbi:MAG: hypothetical protein IBX69_16545 [Anaerolineales bacterium]|nr:hypothetical protein [Anaerolineales bacterium]
MQEVVFDFALRLQFQIDVTRANTAWEGQGGHRPPEHPFNSDVVMFITANGRCVKLRVGTGSDQRIDP